MSGIQFAASNPPSPSFQKGSDNFYIGPGAGPTSVTGFFNGIDPPAGGFAVMENKATQGPSIRLFENTSSLNDFLELRYGKGNTIYENLQNITGSDDIAVTNLTPEWISLSDLYYHFDAGFLPSYMSGSSTWYNLSPGNNSTLFGTIRPAAVANIFDPADSGSLVFNGSNRDIDMNLTNNSRFQSSFTLSFWVDNNGNTNSGRILDKADAVTGTGHNGISVYTAASGTGRFLVYTVIDNTITEFNANLFLDGEWNKIDIVFTNTDITLYKNGASGQVKTNLSNLSNITAANPLYIGSHDSTSNFYNGKIAIASMYTRALSGTEINSNYNLQKVRFGKT